MESMNRQKQLNTLQAQHTSAVRMAYTDRGVVTVEGPVSASRIQQFAFCEGLCKFRQPSEQHLALMDISNLPEGLVYIATCKDTIVGYITFHYPEFERWAQSGMPCLLELGAIEVSREWRGTGISSELVLVPFQTDMMEDKIIVSMECYWFWDLQGTNLTPYEYRRLMENLLAKSNFQTKLTDDPDICSHPANLLSVRIGSRVPENICNQFEGLCYRSKWLL
ncbi:MAG: N-acetyltransferase [Bacillota bacterium]|nr:N-acetyltransferase [Bacillota bacterium]MDW7683738.1 N-acetyltransferase [Bacillota bacterium]